MPDIVDTAVSAGSFNTLVAAVKAAGLVDTLKGPGPFTVLAPNDAAFNLLPPGTVDNLLKDIPKLKSILTYHVIPGKVLSSDIVNLKTAKTVEGEDIRIDSSQRLHRNIKVNEAEIIKSDIIADNGVIHVINRVLIPPIQMAH
jgi:uncharacterized surface protein with fasciclin (FAS1) repeats